MEKFDRDDLILRPCDQPTISSRLVDQGIDTTFMLTGGGAMHLNDAFARHPEMRVVCLHHEQALAIAA